MALEVQVILSRGLRNIKRTFQFRETGNHFQRHIEILFYIGPEMESTTRSQYPDDILQEAWLAAVQRIDHFLVDATRSIFVWFRLIASQTLIDLHRRHLGTQKRNAALEFSINRGWSSDSTSSALSFHLLGHLTSPSQAALREELSSQLQDSLQSMNEIDREVLALRHFEQLSNKETAQILGISDQASSDRYMRALARLKNVLQVLPEFRN